MKPVSSIDAAVTAAPRSGPVTRDSSFTQEVRIARVNDLLRSTDHFDRWKALCHENVDLSVNLADMILAREALLEKSRSNSPIDWERLDTLTGQLRSHGLMFNTSDALPDPSVVASRAHPQEAPSLTAPPPPSIVARKPPVAAGSAIEKAPESSEIGEIPDLSDETLQIMNVLFDRHVLTDGIAGYGNGHRLLLPLAHVAELLGFNIMVNPGGTRATGWFVHEDRTFDLDLDQDRVVVGDLETTLPKGHVAEKDGEIYVSLETLSKWFPVDFKTDYNEMSIRVMPREKLPFQSRIERRFTHPRGMPYGADEVRFPRAPSDYRAAEVPFADISAAFSHTDVADGPDDDRHNYAVLSKGDLAYMTSEIYLSGNDMDSLETARLTLERSDPDAGLLGPLHATQVAVGDIRTPGFPALSGYQMERGVYVGNRELNRSSAFDTTHFEGGLPPGWDVEVYRNNILVGSTRVGNEGRYQFDDIPVYYGINDFKLVFYGPQGQRREETRRVHVGADMLKQGQNEYHLSATHKNTELIDVNDYEGKRPDEKTPKLVATFERGVSDRLTVGGGVSSQEVNESRHTYLNAGIKSNVLGYSVNGDYIHDTKGGNALEGLVQTRWRGVQFRLKQSFFDDFSDDQDTETTDPETSKTHVSVVGLIRENKFLPDMPLSLSYRGINRENSHEDNISATLATYLGRLYLNHSIGYRENSAVETEEAYGSLQIARQDGPFRLRGHVDYELDPDREVTSFELAHLWQINDSASSEVILTRELEDLERTTGSIRLNWNNGKFILSPELSYSSDDIFSVMLSLNTTVGVEPRTRDLRFSSVNRSDFGNISARVFLDKNNNQVFDTGDAPLDTVDVQAIQQYRSALTGRDGISFVGGLQKYYPTDVIIDSDTLEDPFWEPVTQGVSIVPRPGHVHMLDFPVIATGEIDGTIYGRMPNGKDKPLANVHVQLVDKDGEVVQEVRSEYDGFYLFMKVPPGTYGVRIAPRDLDRWGMTGQPALDNEVTADGNVVSNIDLSMAPIPEKAMAAAGPETPEETSPPRAPADLELYNGSSGWVYDLKTMEKAVDAFMRGETPRPEMPPLEKTIAAPPGSASPTRIYEKGKWVYPGESAGAVTPASRPEPRAGKPDVGTTERFGLHLSSYRTVEKAIAGIPYLQKKYRDLLQDQDFSIGKVDLGPEKGVWYRVFAGNFSTKREADHLGTLVKKLRPYCRVLPVDGDKTGVHLTSFHTRQKALQSIDELKTAYPDLLGQIPFHVVPADLGPEKGVWQRVVAGRFHNEKDALNLANRIKLRSPYCLPMKVEDRSEASVHLASFRSSARAAMGLKILQYKLRDTLEDQPLFVKRVDLGPEKGIFYRVMAGRFSDEGDAVQLRKRIQTNGQYAAVIR